MNTGTQVHKLDPWKIIKTIDFRILNILWSLLWSNVSRWLRYCWLSDKSCNFVWNWMLAWSCCYVSMTWNPWTSLLRTITTVTTIFKIFQKQFRFFFRNLNLSLALEKIRSQLDLAVENTPEPPLALKIFNQLLQADVVQYVELMTQLQNIINNICQVY